MTEDMRPEPKPRKNIRLWQSYLIWYELMEIRKRHNLRIIAIERNKSEMDAELEKRFLERLAIDDNINEYRKLMIKYADEVGPIWSWLTSIKGLKAGGEAAKLLALIDDVGKFDTISKLWRYAGWAVVDGKAERNKYGEKSHYNNRLKATCFIIADLFIKHQTPHYVDIYYEEKDRIRELYPEPIPADEGKLWKEDYTNSHVHRMAIRKMVKRFLSDLWVLWRESEGLPVSEPYAAVILGHTNIKPPYLPDEVTP